MSSLLMDFRLAARALRRRPGFAVTCVLTLALGIGATTAIFSVVNAVLFKPLAFRDPGRLVSLWSTHSGADGKPEDYGLSVADFRDFRERQHAFDGIAAMEAGSVNVTGTGEPERVPAGRVSTEFFSVLGVPPQAGRAFLPEDETASVAVISYGLWQRRFGGNAGILGQTMDIDGVAHVVAGVARPDFSFMVPVDVWVPLRVADPDARRQNRSLYAVGRLSGGASLAGAGQEMSGIAESLSSTFPDSNRAWGLKLIPMRDLLVRKVRPTLLVLFAAVGFVLLISCANVSNLLVVRNAERREEIAIRAALGATRGDLVRRTLAESVLLGLLGGLLGTGLALAGLNPLLAAAPADLSNLPHVGLDLPVLFFALLVSVGTGLLFGLAPALLGSSDLSGAMKRDGRGASGEGRGRRFQGALVVGEVALAFLLLFGAGLMTKGFRALLDVDPGFRPGGVVTLELTLPPARFTKHEMKVRTVDRIQERLSALPGVVSAAASTKLPLKEMSLLTGVVAEGRAPISDAETDSAHFRRITPGYFRTIGTPLLEGRDFEAADREESAPVAIVSRAFARKYWPGGSAVGKRVLRPGAKPQRWLEIVGVVGDVRDTALTTNTEPALYVPFAQGAGPATVFLAVRAASGSPPAASTLGRAVREVDPELPIANLAPMQNLVSASLTRQRFAVLLLGFLGAAGLVIAFVGIYGVVAYGVTQRTREIGIRMALGATARSIARMVVSQSTRFAAAGLVIGAAGSTLLARAVADLVVHVRPGDLVVLTGTAAGLFLVTLLASYMPARRAARLDPAVCLRGE